MEAFPAEGSPAAPEAEVSVEAASSEKYSDKVLESPPSSLDRLAETATMAARASSIFRRAFRFPPEEGLLFIGVSSFAVLSSVPKKQIRSLRVPL
jgi:hypothetical protein